jgi:hypothetical protein
VSPSSRAVQQYSTTSDNLTARIALHAFGTNSQDWFSWLAERLPLSNGSSTAHVEPIVHLPPDVHAAAGLRGFGWSGAPPGERSELADTERSELASAAWQPVDKGGAGRSDGTHPPADRRERA